MTKRILGRPSVALVAMYTTWLISPCFSFMPLIQKRTRKPFQSPRCGAAPKTTDNEPSSVSITDPPENRLANATNGEANVSMNNKEFELMKCHKDEKKKRLPGAAWLEETLKKPAIEITEAYLVILSSVLVAIATLSLGPSWEMTIEDWQQAIAYVFVVEFSLRWYSTEKSPIRYLSQPLVIVDIVVVILPVILPMLSGIPPWLTSQSGLINLRLLRILRLQRVLQDLETFSAFTMALGLGNNVKNEVEPYQLQLSRVILSLFTLLSVSAGLIYAAEHGVNPDMDNYFSALYFTLTTLTTVGFGDITPVTFQGKLIVSGTILAGVTIIPAQAAALVESLMNAQVGTELLGKTDDTVSPENQQPNGINNDNKMLPSSSVDAITPCPACGATFHWTSAKYCWSCGAKL